VLLHSGVEWDVVVFAPSSEGVEQKDGVLVALFQQLLSGVFQKQNVTIVKGISNLESIYSISIFGFDLSADLLRSESVLVEAIIEVDDGHATQGLSCNQEVSLSHNSFHLVVLGTQSSESPCTYFFLSVFKESGLFNHSQNLIGYFGASQSDSLLVFKSSLLLFGDGLGDGDGEQVFVALFVSNCLHLDHFKNLHFIHEVCQRISPSLSNSLEVFDLFKVDLDGGKAFNGFPFLISRSLVESLSHSRSRVVLQDIVISHSLQNKVTGLVKSHLVSPDV
jgi:hypothetical protein